MQILQGLCLEHPYLVKPNTWFTVAPESGSKNLPAITGALNVYKTGTTLLASLNVYKTDSLAKALLVSPQSRLVRGVSRFCSLGCRDCAFCFLQTHTVSLSRFRQGFTVYSVPSLMYHHHL